MSVEYDKQRFVFYVSVGDLPHSKASTHLAQAKAELQQMQRDANHGDLPEDEVWYFVAVRGDSRIERL